MLKKFLLGIGLAMLWSSHCFAVAIAKDANVAVMLHHLKLILIMLNMHRVNILLMDW